MSCIGIDHTHLFPPLPPPLQYTQVVVGLSVIIVGCQSQLEATVRHHCVPYTLSVCVCVDNIIGKFLQNTLKRLLLICLIGMINRLQRCEDNWLETH